MCGIAGFINRENTADLNDGLMRQVLNKISHRGPDGSGIWASDNQKVLLGHQRLSIVDLTVTANQPMYHGNQYAIVFNGEIYNHRDLRAELENAGVEFETDHSDTEVLLNGYIHWGIENLLNKINGMFAFAMYDKPSDKLFLCRDRIGIKSLYFSRHQNKLIFCSEIKGILATKRFKPELEASYLNEYLLNRSLQAPKTLFKHVQKLKPGHYLEFDIGSLKLQETRYWNPLDIAIDKSMTDQNALEERLAKLMNSSVEYRLESDVPVGLFLSGGVDSNYILSLIADKRKGIKCFTATYPGEELYDESEDASRMANKFGVEYIEVPITSGNYLNILEQVVYFQEEPISAPVCVPVYYLSEAARNEGIPVILAGEGSDEVFIGYENWLRFRKAEMYLKKVPFLNALSGLGYRLFGSRLNPVSPVHDVMQRTMMGYPLFWGGAIDMNANIRSSLLNDGRSAADLNQEIFLSNIREPMLEFESRRPEFSISSWMTYMDLSHRLPELMLPRLDKMGMAHSIEGRVPFLDHRVVELMFSTPEKVIREQPDTGKSALKALAADQLGHEFAYRKKKGFQAPVAEWKSGEINELTQLLKVFAIRTGLFEVNAVDLLLDRGGRRYFTLLNFMIWYLIYIENVLVDKLPYLKRWDQY